MTTYDYHTNRAYYYAHADEDRDRAVLARIGGRLQRLALTQGWPWGAEAVRAATEALAVSADRGRRAQLPEAAFDWPIYQMATFPDDGDHEPPPGYTSCGGCTELVRIATLPRACYECGQMMDAEGALADV